MNIKRVKRISEEIRRIVSQLITSGLKDPRVSSMTSITKVEVTGDLRYANIYVSTLGDEKVKKETLEGLKSAKGFIRNEIGSNMDLRYIPEPVFHLDESIEQGVYISKLIDKVNKSDEEKRKNIHE